MMTTERGGKKLIGLIKKASKNIVDFVDSLVNGNALMVMYIEWGPS